MAHALTHRQTGHRTDDHNDHNEHHDVREHAVVDKDLQHEQYGGMHFGPTFFGWIVATGMAAILLAVLSAIGSSVALTTGETANTITQNTASTVGLVSGTLLVLALGLAYFAGGYVAGRMARFDGGKQGFGVWLTGIIVTLLLAGLGALLGSQYNLLSQFNLPSVPIDGGTLTTAGLITLVAALVITLLAAITGGKKGAHYHDAIDETGRVANTTT